MEKRKTNLLNNFSRKDKSNKNIKSEIPSRKEMRGRAKKEKRVRKRKKEAEREREREKERKRLARQGLWHSRQMILRAQAHMGMKAIPLAQA